MTAVGILSFGFPVRTALALCFGNCGHARRVPTNPLANNFQEGDLRVPFSCQKAPFRKYVFCCAREFEEYPCGLSWIANRDVTNLCRISPILQTLACISFLIHVSGRGETCGGSPLIWDVSKMPPLDSNTAWMFCYFWVSKKGVNIKCNMCVWIAQARTDCMCHLPQEGSESDFKKVIVLVVFR